MCNCISRRDFMGASLVAGGVMIAPHSAAIRPLVADKSAGTRNGTRIFSLYLGGQDPKWPSPSIDMEAERRDYEARLRTMANMWRHRDQAWDAPVEFAGGELVRSQEEFRRVVRSMHDVDGLLVFHLAIPDDGLAAETLKLDYPMVFYFPSPSTAGFIGVNNAARKGARAELVYTSDLDELASPIRMIDAIRRLKSTRVLSLSNRAESKLARYNPDKMNKIFGVSFKEMNFDRINELMAAADER